MGRGYTKGHFWDAYLTTAFHGHAWGDDGMGYEGYEAKDIWDVEQKPKILGIISFSSFR